MSNTNEFVSVPVPVDLYDDVLWFILERRTGKQPVPLPIPNAEPMIVANPAPPPGDQYLTMREAGEYLKVSQPTLRSMTHDGRLRSYRSPLDSRIKLYLQSDLDAVLMRRAGGIR